MGKVGEGEVWEELGVLFEHVWFGISNRHSRRDVEWTVEYIGLEVKREVCVGERHLRVLRIEVVI